MSAFPNSPTNGQIVVIGFIPYIYASADNSWTKTTDANLVAANIKNGVSILGVTGNYSITWGNLSTVTCGSQSITYRMSSDGKMALIYGIANGIGNYYGLINDGAGATAIATALSKTLSSRIDMDSHQYITQTYSYTSPNWVSNGGTSYWGNLLCLLLFS